MINYNYKNKEKKRKENEINWRKNKFENIIEK
jgi:hypothetical protein